MVELVKAKLYGNKELIVDLLNKNDFHNISGDKILSFAFDCDSSGSCKLNTDNLTYKRWSTGEGGDIFSLLQSKNGYGFKKSLLEIKSFLGMSTDVVINNKVDVINKDLLFCGLFGDLKELMGDNKYTENDISIFTPIISETFRNDGIDIITQDEFDIRYDKDSDRIVILWKDIDGNVVGCNARANWNIYDGYKYKYISLLNFSKGNHLFGAYNNKSYISESRSCYIFEAEKSTMQSFSFGKKNCVSLGCKNIRKEQVEILNDLGVDNIYLCFDEDVEWLHYVDVAMEINNIYPHISIYGAYDKEKKYLEKGSKKSPTDIGINKYEEILNNCLTKIV